MKKWKLFTGLLPLAVCSFFPVYSQPLSWQTRGAGGGGALFYPTINPANDNEFYVACDMSQLFHSTDFGASYTQVPFTKLQVGNRSTYEFTGNSNVAYCIANNGDINYPARTLDGGTTWTGLANEPLPGDDVYALKADYANPGRLILDYYNALYISANNGASFTLIKNAASSGAGITVAGVFFDGNNIYIGTNEGILYSSNGGGSFSFLSTSGLPSGETIFSFAGARSGSTTRFFCITAAAADVYNGVPPWDYYGFAKGVYAMDAGTNTWAPKTTGISFATDFVMYVGMARNDVNTVYLGGSDGATGGNLVMKTTNGGASWSKVFLTASNQNIRTGWSGYGGDRGWGFGEACFGISVAPNNSAKVLFGDFGFVHKTSDGGASWQQAYVNTADEHPPGASTPQKQSYHSTGLENTTCWQVHWQDANNMFAAFSDIGGIRSKDGGGSWGFDYTGHTANSMYRIAKHITNGTLFAATSGVHDMYQSTRLQDAALDATDANGKIIYSTNNGASWQPLHQFNHPVFWVATDPTNSNRFYASVIHYNGGSGQGGIWVTNDLNNLGTSTWTKLSNPPRTQGHPASIVVLNDGKVVCTFSGRRTSAGAFTASSGVFIYDPASSTWTDVSDAGMQYWTKDIVIDPSDGTQNTWYACVFSGWGGAPNGLGGLYKTINRGSSWTKLTGSQFDRVTSLAFNPSNASQAYLTTETQGLWISNNASAATPAWQLVSDYPFRQPERVFFNPYNNAEVWVTSFGNGLKTGVVSTALPLRLVSFSARRSGAGTALQLLVSNEGSGDRFVFEKSTDAVHFSEIKTLSANGTARYECNDNADAPVVNYRVKLVNGSDKFFYSNVIALRKGNPGNGVRLLLNPVSETLPLQAELDQPDRIELWLVAATGRAVLHTYRDLGAGLTRFSLPLPPYCLPGAYVLRLKSNRQLQSIKVLLAK